MNYQKIVLNVDETQLYLFVKRLILRVSSLATAEAEKVFLGFLSPAHVSLLMNDFVDTWITELWSLLPKQQAQRLPLKADPQQIQTVVDRHQRERAGTARIPRGVVPDDQYDGFSLGGGGWRSRKTQAANNSESDEGAALSAELDSEEEQMRLIDQEIARDQAQREAAQRAEQERRVQIQRAKDEEMAEKWRRNEQMMSEARRKILQLDPNVGFDGLTDEQRAAVSAPVVEKDPNFKPLTEQENALVELLCQRIDQDMGFQSALVLPTPPPDHTPDVLSGKCRPSLGIFTASRTKRRCIEQFNGEVYDKNNRIAGVIYDTIFTVQGRLNWANYVEIRNNVQLN